MRRLILIAVAAASLVAAPGLAQTAPAEQVGEAAATRLGHPRAEMPVDLAALNGKLAKGTERTRRQRSAETDPAAIQKRLLNRARVLPGLCTRYHC